MDLATIRWGVVATGNIAGVFTRELGHLPDHEVAAVCSRSLPRAQAFAADHGIPRAYDDVAALCADDKVDAVYVATPHSDHLHTATRAIDAGKAVLVEKAFTVNTAEAERLVAHARARGVFCMEAMWMRCNPLHREILELVARGDLGEIRGVTADLGFPAEVAPTDRLLAPELAGGALLDVGVYPVALAHAVLGVPDRVTAWGRRSDSGVDLTFAALFGYAGGAHATLTGSLEAPTSRRAAIAGTEGLVELPASFHDASSYVVHRPGREPEERRVELVGAGYVYEAEEVAAGLRDGRAESPLVPLDGTLEVQRLLDEIRAQLGVRYPFEL